MQFRPIVGGLATFAIASCAYAQETSIQARSEALVAALSGDGASAFEQTAQRSFSPAALARRTPAAREGLWRQVHGEFGRMEIVSIEVEGNTAQLRVLGETGNRARISIEFDDSPERLIAGIGIEMGGGEEEGPAFPQPPINARMSSEELSRALQPWLTNLSQERGFSGAVLVARNGEAVFSQAIGQANREQGAAVTLQTRFNVASIGKIFTRTSIARLIQEGRLSLSDTIGQHLPNYPNAEARGATIAQLIDFQAGIADFFGPSFEVADKTRFASNHDYFQFVSALPQQFAPGSRTEYCNGCYVVLGEIIERVSGMTFEDYVARQVFTPAGMSRSGYFNKANLPSDTAIPYTQEGATGAGPINAAPQFPAAGSGAGGLYSTLADLLAFESALRSHRLLNPQWTAWVLNSEPANGRNQSPIGIAGGTMGANAILESNGVWTVIVLGNCDPPVAERSGLAIMRQLSGGE
jgi:CubicO group peptidase (beta-lactamase class C family)